MLIDKAGCHCTEKDGCSQEADGGYDASHNWSRQPWFLNQLWRRKEVCGIRRTVMSWKKEKDKQEDKKEKCISKNTCMMMVVSYASADSYPVLVFVWAPVGHYEIPKNRTLKCLNVWMWAWTLVSHYGSVLRLIQLLGPSQLSQKMAFCVATQLYNLTVVGSWDLKEYFSQSETLLTVCCFE